MRRGTIYLLTTALVVTLVGAQPAVAAGRKDTATVRMKNLSSWGSSDTTGLTYQKQTRRLLISDADVDETSAWRGRNFFISTLGGRLLRARKLFTMEPEDLAWDGRHRNLYVTNDDPDIVYRVRAGRDGKFGTRDDRVAKVLDTHRFGSFDPEGLAVRVGRRKVTLIITDATNDKVYKVGRGRDRRFGTRDDTVRSFGMRRFGFSDTEDVWYDGKTGHLFVVTSHWAQPPEYDGPKHFIAEVTWKRGRLVNRIFFPNVADTINASGIVIAPPSQGRSRHFYVTDSGKRAEGNPGQNDGRLWELRIT